MSIRPNGDTAGGFVFDDFVDKQVVHVSATSFRSRAERVSMYVCEARLCVRAYAQVGREEFVRLFYSPDLRRLGLYCCQAWTVETV